MYRDIESGETVTLETLRVEYDEQVQRGEIDKEEEPFEWYVYNCQSCSGGTLEKV